MDRVPDRFRRRCGKSTPEYESAAETAFAVDVAELIVVAVAADIVGLVLAVGNFDSTEFVANSSAEFENFDCSAIVDYDYSAAEHSAFDEVFADSHLVDYDFGLVALAPHSSAFRNNCRI